MLLVEVAVMISLLRRLAHDFLWDEAMALRAIGGGLYLIGQFLLNGGTIPGTSIVLPIQGLVGDYWKGVLSSFAPLLLAAAVYLAGARLPSSTRAAGPGSA
jgi:hypothetical protein